MMNNTSTIWRKSQNSPWSKTLHWAVVGLGVLLKKKLVYGGAQSSSSSQKSTLLGFWKEPPWTFGNLSCRTEVAGLFRPESDFDDGTTEEPTPSDLNIIGVFRAFYLASRDTEFGIRDKKQYP